MLDDGLCHIVLALEGLDDDVLFWVTTGRGWCTGGCRDSGRNRMSSWGVNRTGGGIACPGGENLSGFGTPSGSRTNSFSFVSWWSDFLGGVFFFIFIVL